MRTTVFTGNKTITTANVPEPQAGPGEVLVRVRHTALCGSDLRLWRDGSQITPGHEIFGVVDAPGHALHGTRQVVYIPVHCGECDSCRAGDTQMCLTTSVLVGWNRPGGYAECLAVPEQCLLPVPDDVEDLLAPLLLDTIGTSAHAVRFIVPIVPPDRPGPVLVMGAGPVGLGVIIALRDCGYQDIHVFDPKADRVALAQRFGAVPYSGEGKRFKLIMECSGAHAARNAAIPAILPRGAILLIGENSQPWTINEDRVFRRKDFFMVRSFYFPKSDHPANCDLLRREKASFRILVDAEFDFDAFPEGFSRFASGLHVKPLFSVA